MKTSTITESKTHFSKNCKAEEQFITHFLPICFANDLPRIKPYYNAVDNRVRIISYAKKFVDEPNENELKKDYGLMHEMKTVKFQRVFVGLLIRRYCWGIQEQYDTLPQEVTNANIGKPKWSCMRGVFSIHDQILAYMTHT